MSVNEHWPAEASHNHRPNEPQCAEWPRNGKWVGECLLPSMRGPRWEAELVAAERVKLKTTWEELEAEFEDLAPVVALFP